MTPVIKDYYEAEPGILNPRNVYKARQIIYKYVTKTPSIYSRKLFSMIGFNLYLKLENLQATRTSKIRSRVYYIPNNRDEATGTNHHIHQ